jgi:hypothetical protein
MQSNTRREIKQELKKLLNPTVEEWLWRWKESRIEESKNSYKTKDKAKDIRAKALSRGRMSGNPRRKTTSIYTVATFAPAMAD